MKKAAFYKVLTIKQVGRKRQWVVVNERPLPRSEAALLVAVQWREGRVARIAPAAMPKVA